LRMIVPPLAYRRAIDRDLATFFRTHRRSAFWRAIREMCRFYKVKRPRVEWYEYIDWGKTAGKTYEDGRILLVHPENWKRGRIYNSERKWVQMIYHEMGHYLFWTNPERKADIFTRRMVVGLRNGDGSHPASTNARRLMSARRAAAARGHRTRDAALRRAAAARVSRARRIAAARARRRRARAAAMRARRKRTSG
jgi:hypothetical protein